MSNLFSFPYRNTVTGLIGALLIVGLCSITTVDVASDVAPPDSQKLVLGGIQMIEQTFTTSRPDMVGITILLRPGGPDDANLEIPIRLRYTNGPPIDMVNMRVPVRAAQNGVLRVQFPQAIISRDPYVPTETLRLILDIPTIAPGTGPVITAYKKLLEDSAMVIDRTPQPKLVLAITPLYQRRWADSIWPISAMANGKPGFLGWPPFYVLLAYFYLITLGKGVIALRLTQSFDDKGAL